jgi:1,4-alpha-glucan branching enzyme
MMKNAKGTTKIVPSGLNSAGMCIESVELANRAATFAQGILGLDRPVVGGTEEGTSSDSLIWSIASIVVQDAMNGRSVRISQALVVGSIFFALIGKPLSSTAAPSTQVGIGSIPYSGVWSNGSQAGTGFGAWQLSQTTNGPSVFFYVNSSTQTDNGAAPGNGSNDINTAGVAWGMTALNGALASATRPFPSPLTNGQSFQIDMDNGFINSGGSVGFALQNSSGNAVWQYYFSGGSNTYTINAASVSGSALPNFTDVGMHLTFSLTSTNMYSLSVLAYTPGGTAGQGTTYNYTGTLLNPTGGLAITSVRLFNLNAGGGTNFNAYFNSMSISGGVASDTASSTAYTTPGTTFRVWAPNASAVDVAGSWNQFRTNATPLYGEGNGNWSADVTGALNGNQYLYYISNSAVGTNVFKQDPRCREEVSSTGNSIIYNTTSFNWAGDTFTAAGLSNVVVYELHCGSFYDPGFPGNPGTFYNATNLLPQLQRVGINAVEVMPIAEFGGNFNWGYDAADIFGVENSYGGPDAFKTFVKACHQFGMAVLVDTVHNHYGGTDGPTYGDLSYSLWDFDGYDGGLNGGGIYFNPTNGWCCTPYGPRPNTSTTQVRNFIQDNITEWLSECHVDGFRWDDPSDWMNGSVDGTNIFIASAQSLIEQISSMIHTAYVGKINIGENSGYLSGVSGFDSTWYSSPFQGDVVSQLTATNDALRNMGSISTAVNANNNGAGASGWANVYFTDTHDSAGDLNGGQRVPVLVDSAAPTSYYARKLSTMGAVTILTSAGIPMILQGAEMLVTNQFSATNPLNWSLTNTYSGIVSLYTDLVHLRLNLNGRSSGLEGLHTSTILEDNANKLIAYRRWNTGNVGDDVIVICNFANTNWPAYNIGNFPHTNIWYTQFNSDWTKYGSDYGNYGSASTTVSVSTATISIAPYSVLILSQNIPGAPPTPQNIRVTSVGTNQVSFAWNISSGATGYIVNRGTNQIATTSTTNYTDSGLTAGAMYCYSVEATNIGGISAPSATVCATTLPATGATNLLAYWTFDEGAGTIAYDYSGNSNTGTVFLDSNNGGTWTNGIINGALFFDGDLTEVTVPNSSSLNPVNGITLAAWVNASESWYQNNRILEKGASDNQYALLINGSGQIEFLVAGVANVVASPPSAGAWHHVAGTYDGSSMISLYIDGQLATQQLATGVMPVTTDSLAIGNKPPSDSPADDFYGAIDDVRIYGSALPAAQIAQLYNTDSVGDGIPNWWRAQYFGNSSSTDATSCAACDFDGTGQNNQFKYVAGLDPTDPTQVFTLQIAPVSSPQNQMDLIFNPISSGRTYTVQFNSSLATGTYNNLTGASTQTNGSLVTVTDPNPAPSNEFYRVHISLP